MMDREAGRQMPGCGNGPARFDRMLVFCLVALVSCSLSFADAPDKARDLTKARQAERERAAASIPLVPPEAIYRRWFDAMKAGRFEEASRYVADEALRATKAAVIRVLRDATLEERAQFIKAGRFRSASDIQLSSPAKVYAGWLRGGWRPPAVLQRIRQSDVAEIRLAQRGEGQLLVVEMKTASGTAREEVPCEQRERQWRLKVELWPEAGPVR